MIRKIGEAVAVFGKKHLVHTFFATALYLLFISCPAQVIDQTSIEVAVRGQYFDFIEAPSATSEGVQLDSRDSGMINGLRISYLRLNPDADRDFRVNVCFSRGNVNYTGTDRGGNPLNGTNSEMMLSLEALAMYQYFEKVQTQLYCGLGYEAWWRGICVDSSGAQKELYGWLYVPVGLRYKYEFSNSFSCEPDLSARLTLAGTVGASGIPVNGQTYSITMQLGSQYGLNLNVPFLWKLDKEISVVLTPWMDYSRMSASNTYTIAGNYQIMEPASQTWQYGADLGLRYTF